MEVVKSRYGTDRSIERIDFGRVMIMGESEMYRQAINNKGVVTLFDFEGGPCYTLGGKIAFEGMHWKINSISTVDSGFDGLIKCVLGVSPIYPSV